MDFEAFRHGADYGWLYGRSDFAGRNIANIELSTLCAGDRADTSGLHKGQIGEATNPARAYR